MAGGLLWMPKFNAEAGYWHDFHLLKQIGIFR